MSLSLIGDKWIDLALVPTGSNVIDAGVGMNVDFSAELRSRLGCKCLLIDPCPASITFAESKSFKTITGAIAPKSGPIRVYTGRESESIYFDHRNSRQETYESSGVVLSDLIKELHPSLVKLDIEGAEYEVYEQCFGVPQVHIEFHHDIVARFREHDTIRVVEHFLTYGYKLLYMTKFAEATVVL